MTQRIRVAYKHMYACTPNTFSIARAALKIIDWKGQFSTARDRALKKQPPRGQADCVDIRATVRKIYGKSYSL